ncbi:MAG: hypothetical protein KIS87_02465 [Phycisphaeraceae bacterium]|nr:hypothetical protein [Phycisphaeraceae bacterium]
MPDVFDEIPGSFDWTEGPPLPRWEVVSAWVEERYSEGEQIEVWRGIALQWLERIKAWSGGLRVDAHHDFVLLSPYPPRDAEGLLRFLQTCRTRICDAFPDLALKAIAGPFAALVFRDHEGYYDYVSAFDPEEGEWGTSGGTFINRGYGHIVTKAIPQAFVRHALSHELVHAHFAHRCLPLWLEEGLTQSATDVLVGTSSLRLDRELVARHRDYWTRHGLAGFWSGTAFHDPGDGQELAYSLAHVIFLRELADRRERFLQFLRDANEEDFGRAACERRLGETLEALVERFLGPIVPDRPSAQL